MKISVTLVFLAWSILLFGQEGATSTQTAVPGPGSSNLAYWESLYLHVNTNFILTGETLYFAAYCLDAKSRRPSSVSSLAYVELVDGTGAAVFRVKIALEGGFGGGDFFLPSTLPTGNYTLVAYTRWMKNFPVSNFFRKQITVINPFNKGFAETNSKPRNVRIGLSPEGGNLIAGSENTVAFKAVNEKGKGVNFNGKIIDENGTIVSEFGPGHHGTGKLTLTPQAGRTYKVMIMDSLRQPSFEALPAVATEGVLLHAGENEKEFHVRVEDHFASPKEVLSLRILDRNELIQELPLTFAGHIADVNLEKQRLPIGILTISVVTAQHRVLAHRSVLNRSTASGDVVMQIEKTMYGTREKVTVSLVNDNHLQSARVSMSVHKVDQHVFANQTGIGEFLYGAGSPDAGVLAEASDAMLLIGDLEISGAPQEQPQSVMFLPDMRGDLISGIVFDSKSRVPLQQETVYLSSPAPDYVFLVSKTDSAGRFYFNAKNLRPSSELVLQLGIEASYDNTIEVDEGFVSDHASFLPNALEIDTVLRKAIEERSVLNQIENVFYTVKKDSVVSIRDSLRFFGHPGMIYKLDDYTRFPTMEDIFREYVPEVVVKKRKEKFELRVINAHTGFQFLEAPLVLIDGVPVFDTELIMKYDPLKIRTMEVLRKKYFYASSQAGGIISFATYGGDAKDLQLVGAMRKSYTGLLPSRVYYSPAYGPNEKDLSHIPDFRIQLCWKPAVTLAPNGKEVVEFYTGDAEGEFEIEVEGIRADGNPIHLRRQVQVSANR